LKVRCITRVSERNRTFLPREIIPGLSIDRVESLEKLGAVIRINELDPMDLAAVNPTKLTVAQLRDLVKAKSNEKYDCMKKDDLLATLNELESGTDGRTGDSENAPGGLPAGDDK